LHEIEAKQQVYGCREQEGEMESYWSAETGRDQVKPRILDLHKRNKWP
jgi:hypothetical protein